MILLAVLKNALVRGLAVFTRGYRNSHSSCWYILALKKCVPTGHVSNSHLLWILGACLCGLHLLFLWNVFMALLYYVLSLLLLPTSTTAAQRIHCWRNSYMTQSLFTDVKAECFCCREAPCQKHLEALGSVLVRLLFSSRSESQSWVLQKRNSLQQWKLVFLLGSFASPPGIFWCEANIKVLLEQSVGAVSVFLGFFFFLLMGSKSDNLFTPKTVNFYFEK